MVYPRTLEDVVTNIIAMIAKGCTDRYISR